MQFSNLRPTDNATLLQKLGNLSYVVMGMYTEGGRTPYAMTVSANALPGATWINGNWWQGSPSGPSGYSLGVMQYDFGNFSNTQNTLNFAQQVQAWATSQGKSLDVGSAANLAAQLAMKGGTPGVGLNVQGNWISANDRDIINGYTASNAGQTWVYSNLEVGSFTYNSAGDIVRGTGAVTQAVALIQPALNTQYFQNLSVSNQQQVEILLLKEANQTGNIRPALAWLKNQGNSVGSASDFYTAMMINFGGTNTGTGLISAWDASLSLQAIQESSLFSPMWANAQSKSLDAPTIVQDPESVALRALFTYQASSSTIREITNKTPGTFSGDGKNGFIAVDSLGNVVVLQSAVSNGTSGSNGGAPATAQGWQLDSTGTWQGFTEGIGRGSRYIIRLVPGPKNDWEVVAQNEDGSETPMLTLAQGDAAHVNINGTDVTLDASKDGQYAFANNGDFYRSGLSVDGTVYGGEIFTGQYAGYSYREPVGSGTPSGFDPSTIYASYSSSTVNNTLAEGSLYLSDGKGKEISIYTHIATVSTDSGSEVLGIQKLTSVTQNGVLQSVTDARASIDGQTTSTDITTNDPTTGAFLSHTISTTAPDDNGNPRVTEQSLDVYGGQTSKTVITQVGSSTQANVYGADNQLQSTTSNQTFDDGTSLVNVKYANGAQTVISTDLDGNSKQVDYTVPGDTNIQSITNRNALGNITATSTITQSVDENFNPIANTYDIVQRDAADVITATGTRTVNPTDGSHTDALIGSATAQNPSGTLTVTQTNAAGVTQVLKNNLSLSNLDIAATGFNDAYAIYKAFQSGNDAGLTHGVLSGANDFSTIATGKGLREFSMAANGLGAIMGLEGMKTAWEQGHGLAFASSAASAITAGAGAYANYMGYASTIVEKTVNGVTTTVTQSGLDGALANTSEHIFGEATSTISAISEAVPYLGIAAELESGNLGGAVGESFGLYLTQFGYATGPVGAVIGLVVGMILGELFGDSPPPPWGSASAAWDPVSGTIVINSRGESGGDVAAHNALGSLKGNLTNMAQQYNSQAQPDFQIGIIPQRLGGLSYSLQGFHVSTIDPVTGAALNANLRFDVNTGQAINADVTDPVYFQSLDQYYINNALARQAIAPDWEVQTSLEQATNGVSNAGLSEVERAADLGHLAAVLPADATTEYWNPIGIDLGGALATSELSNSTVQFNVDGTASLDARLSGSAAQQYLKQTAWLNSQDGFLVLDKNVNGGIDNAEELFSNAQVNAQSRGVASLATWDTQASGQAGYGVIDANDAVFGHLEVWQDANGDGLVEQGEHHHLSDLGITGLNYQMGTYSKADGTNDHQMSTLTLQAQTLGHAYTARADGIQIDSSTGQSQLLVTQVHDLSSLQANEDGFATQENLTAVIQVRGDGANVHGLLDNDQVSNAPNAVLSVTAVGNAQHGTVSLDANAGTVTFTPDAGFYGTAGFDYTVNAGAYGQATAHAQVTVTQDDQAPEITGEQNTQIPIYGYSIVTTGVGNGGDSGIQGETIVTPLYQPGYGYATTTGEGGYAYRDTVVTYETDVYSGAMSVTDVDDPISALTWSVVSPAHHGTASIDNSGHWTFSGAQAVGGNDAFMVQVKDPSGKTDTFAITVPLPAAPAGGTGGGGGDGGYTPPDTATDTASGGISGDTGGVDGGGDTGGTATAPVVFDLAGTGFHFKSVNDSNVFLQSATDGLRHRTAWFEGGNGVLAFDKYGDGVVHDSSQIAFKNYLPTAQSDLQGVAAFDSNHDGVITQDDALWSKLGVWVDANQDGICDTGEYQTLGAVGISSIGLTSDNQFSVDQGVIVNGVSSFTRTDGTIGQTADAVLSTSSDVLVANADGTIRVAQVAQADPANPMVVDDGNYLVLGDQGDNVISAGNGNNVISTGAGNDLIQAGNGSNTVLSGDGKDMVVLGSGDNTVMLGAGPKIVIVGKGNNLVTGGPGNNIIMAGDGNNTLYAGSGNSVVYAGHGDNSMVGGVGRNELIAGNGNNMFTDGGGRADMFAGTGSNTFVVTNTLDTITVALAEGATQGTNTVKAQVNWTLGANQQILWGTGSAALTLTGNDQGDQIIGNGAADTLIGGAGNDTLADSGGAATLIGGQGDDTYIVSNAATVVVEQENAGNDTIKSSVSYTLSQNVETLIGTGNAALTLTGGSQDGATLVANNANTTLVAGSGIATLIGGTGNDTFVVNNTADVVQAQAAGNTNTILTSVSYTASANVQNLTGTGSADITLSGNGLNNVITANAGNDTLVAGSGNATFITGSGMDTLIGGAGSDTYLLNNSADNVLLGSGWSQVTGGNVNLALTGNASGSATIKLADGNSQIDLSANNNSNSVTLGDGSNLIKAGNGGNTVKLGAGTNSVALGDGNNNLTTADTTGIVDTLQLGNGNNQITTGQGDDYITAGDGANTLTGGNGNNTVLLGAGADSVTLGDGNNNVSTADAAGVNDTITLGQGNNQVAVSNGNDTITLGNGNNSVTGGNGNDTLNLGAGTNSVTVGDGNNSVTTADTEGVVDTLQLGQGNNQITTGQGDDSITAGDGANTLIGGNGNNTVKLGSGADSVTLGDGNNNVTTADTAGVNDTITLGQGNNQVSVSNGNDTITLGNGNNSVTGGNGNDTLSLGAGTNSVTLGDGNNSMTTVDIAGIVDTLQLGNGNNQITTGQGDDRITAGDGANTLTSGNGNNTVKLGFGTDSVTLGDGNNSVTIADAAGVNDTITLGQGNNQVAVSNGNDTVTLGNGNNSVTGGNGNDTLNLGAGSNTVVLGDGNDSVTAHDLAGAINQVILGNGNDLLTLGNGNNQITTGNGNSQIQVGNGRNSVTVGNGNNSLTTGSGANALHVGTGNNTISNQGGIDSLYFDPSVPLESLNFSHVGSDLLITEGVGNGSVRVLNGYIDPTAAIAQYVEGDGNVAVHFDNGTYNFVAGNGTDSVIGGDGIYTVRLGDGNDLVQMGAGNHTVALGNGNNLVTLGNGESLVTLGNGTNKLMVGGGKAIITVGDGDNTIIGGDGSKTVNLGSGNDSVTLGNGNNIVNAGAGTDTVALGNGNNIVTLGAGHAQLTLGNGADSIYTNGGTDAIVLGSGQYNLWNKGAHDSVSLATAASDKLWFQRQNDNLVISVMGTKEKLTVNNWYAGNQIDSLTTSDGHSINNTGISQLVQAMAAFAPPSSSQTSYTTKEQNALAPVLAANWQ